MIIVLLAVAVTAIGLLSNVIAGDQSLTSWLKQQPWYTLRNALLALGAIMAIAVILELSQQASTRAKGRAPGALTLAIDPSVRSYLLDKVETERVHERLHQGLRDAIRVDMKLTEKLDAVRPGLWIHRITESGPPEERRTEDDIQAVFKQANGRLLILGEPGTGKTN